MTPPWPCARAQRALWVRSSGTASVSRTPRIRPMLWMSLSGLCSRSRDPVHRVDVVDLHLPRDAVVDHEAEAVGFGDQRQRVGFAAIQRRGRK